MAMGVSVGSHGLLDGGVGLLEAHKSGGGDRDVGERIGEKEGEGGLQEAELVRETYT